MISPNSVILKWARNAKSLDLGKAKREAIVSNDNAILDLNKDQIRHGVSSDGQSFRDYLSPAYAQFKASLSSYLASSPTPDLFFTGSYQKALALSVNGNSVDITSTDGKAGKLAKYKAEGLNKEALEKAIVPVTNTYIKQIGRELRK